MPVTGVGGQPTPGYTLSPAEQQALSAFTSSGSSGGSGAGQVYLGTAGMIYGDQVGGARGGQRLALDGGQGQPGIAAPSNVPVWQTIQQAKQFFGTFTQKQVNDFVSMGVMAGQLKPGDGWLEAGTLWNKLVDEAARVGASGQQISPFDILRSYVTNQSSAGQWVKSKDGLFETNTLTGMRRYVGPQFRTTTTSAVNLTDPATAKATATAMFQQLLGRDPLPGELSSYSSALTAAEQANPTVITTTNQYDDLGNIVATTKQDQKGGYSADAQKFLAEQQIKAKPEFGATQAATTYENAFESAVFGAPR